MNISAKLKNSQQPDYIFNFNIDIPIKYKSTISQRSNPTSPAKSPGKINQKKYKLSSITPRPTGVATSALNMISKKSERSGKKSNKKSSKIPKTMKQQFLQKDFHHSLNNGFCHQQKRQQPSISRKTQKMVNNKKSLANQQICPSRRTVKHIHVINQSQVVQKKNLIRNISILQKLVTDDNIIKYTTDSSQLKNNWSSYNLQTNNFVFKQAQKQQDVHGYDKSQRIGTTNHDQFDLIEIREYEQLSTQRKQRINYEYLKEKILIQASVRRIQRAWRNYRTKKLVNSYSTTISSKIFKNQLITTARSETRGINISVQKKQFKSNQLYQAKHDQKPNISQNQEVEQCSSEDSFGNDFQDGQIENQVFKAFAKKRNHATGKILNNFFENKEVKEEIQNITANKDRLFKANLLEFKIQQKTVTQQNQLQNMSNKFQRQIQQKLKKFQQQQIRKWQSILDSIKKGKNIQVLLQKSEKYKKQLQNNLKQINLSGINQNRASPILFRSNSSKSSLNERSEINKQNQVKDKQIKIPYQIQKQLSKNSQGSFKQDFQRRDIKQEVQNQTAQKRKQKIMFFQNEILKIDNQEYSGMSSVSCESFNNIYPTGNNRNDEADDLQQRQKQQNIKLRKKLQLFNIHFLDLSSADQGLTDRSLKGLKSKSIDKKRKNLNKRFNPRHNQQLAEHQLSQQNEQWPSSSQQGRMHRRTDVKIITNKIKGQRPINKIEELINKKIVYPEEFSSQQSQLQIGGRQGSLQEQIKYHQDSDCSDQIGQDSVGQKGYQTLLNSQNFYGQPVLTHRQRKLQVPELKLQNIPKVFAKLTLGKQTETKPNPLDRQTFKSQLDKEMIQKQRKQELLVLFALLKDEKQPEIVEVENNTPKVDMKDVLKICGIFEEELIYQSLLQFSDSDLIVTNIKGLLDQFKKQSKKIKPQGICTNLQSIKDYLQNFVGFVFQNKMTNQIQNCLWTPSGPKVTDLLKYLRKDADYQSDQNQYIMEIEIFQKHWKYANSNIYFDKKYSNQNTQLERMTYLKGLTRVYFRSIFDVFNESLQFQRSFGFTGKPYPWSGKVVRQSKKSIKTAFQQAYRRVLKICVVYYGVHFDDKTHLFNEESIKQLQEQRLLTLLMMQLEQDEYRWSFIEDQLAELKYDLSLMIEQQILKEVLSQLKVLQTNQLK